MRYGINESIVLFVAPYLANKEGCIKDQTEDNQQEEDDSENQQRDFAPVEKNPTDIQRDRKRNQTSAQCDEEGY